MEVELARFHGKTVVVTGGHRGIGKAISQLFSAEGARVFSIGRSGDGAGFDDGVGFIRADLASASGRRAACAAILAMGTLDVLVNNAGVFHHGPLPEGDARAAVMAITIDAPMMLARAALPLLQAAGGSVINISSLNALRPRPEAEAYSAAKAALEAMTRAFAIEVGGMGVRVNAVAPGPIPTALLAEAISGEDPAFMLPYIPLGRLGKP